MSCHVKSPGSNYDVAIGATQDAAGPSPAVPSQTSSGHALSALASRLLRQQAFVAGRWCSAQDGAVIAVSNPADRAMIGHVPDCGEVETRAAITAAAKAQCEWARLTVHQRAPIIRHWANLMELHRTALSEILTLEQGKPIREARGEIDYAAGFLSWFAEEGLRLAGDIVPSHIPGRELLVARVPVGVTAAITPWNFPSAMITRKAGAALMAGCAMIVRPAPETPFSALALAVLSEEAGLPAGLFSVVTGNHGPIIDTLMDSPVVRKVSFTGSTGVGRQMMQRCAGTVKKLSMELGGHAPLIVLDDADLDTAVALAMDAKFQTSGQDCLAANRIIVHRTIYEPFCRRFTEKTAALRLGDGFDEATDIGPLIGDQAIAKCAQQVSDALEHGARLLAGGLSAQVAPQFYPPTVLADVTDSMAIFREETFGPVAAIIPFDTDREAVTLANDSEFGLAAYCIGTDLGRAWAIADELEYGMVGVNCVSMTGPPVPFGGVKQSGLGREGGRAGIEEYSEIKYLCINKEPYFLEPAQ